MHQISLHILDITQNSLRAGADRIEINITCCSPQQRMSICIQDNGCGMEEQVRKQIASPFFTTKQGNIVGLGIPLFKASAEQTGGTFDIQSNHGYGTTVQAVYQLNHIDCMPLGDMGTTIITLMSACPNIQLIYAYRMDGVGFMLDTAELNQMRGGAPPIYTPGVLQLIRQHINQNTPQLQHACGLL